MLPFDLHVLGLPPAFTLSQDQTLHLKLLSPKANALNAERLTLSLYVYRLQNLSKLQDACESNVCKMDS